MRKRDEPIFEYERLARLIESKGWSLGQLEIQSGVSKSQISLMSRNERPNVSAAIVGKLAIALGTTTDYLLGLTGDPRPLAVATEYQKALASLSDQGLLAVQMYAELSADDQAVVNGLIRHLDEKRKSVERLQVALELVEMAGRVGGEGARSVALRVMNEDMSLDEAMAELGESADSSILHVGRR